MKNKTENEVYFTPKQAAEHFNLSLSTVKNYIYAGKLKTLKTPGGHHRIRKSELLATLGDRTALKECPDALSLTVALCNAMLSVFKTLGPGGESLILHARKVSELSSKITRSLNMNESDIRITEIAGLLHDIGHMGIDRRILLKPGRLTSQEYALIKRHPGAGGKILSSIKGLSDIADIVAQHHERMDGKGYPIGLSGEEIRKPARIISVAEAYDSMVSESSYKRPIPKDMAIAELRQHMGTQFDKDVVEVFVNTQITTRVLP